MCGRGRKSEGYWSGNSGDIIPISSRSMTIIGIMSPDKCGELFVPSSASLRENQALETDALRALLSATFTFY